MATHITIPMARLIELETAEHERDILRTENAKLAHESYTWSKAAEVYAKPRQPLTRQQIDDVMTQHYPLSSLVREEVDAFEAAVAETHANAPQHLMEYRAALALVREHSDLWTPAAVKEDVFTSLAIEERRP